MVALNSTVRQVALQFSFSNPDVIPATVKRQERETPKECVKRVKRRKNSSGGGLMVIEPTRKCSLVEFLGELETAGYEMVDSFYKERINAKYPCGKRSYHMVRFLFARREFVDLSDEFKKVRDTNRTELWSICEAAMWRVRAFSNPFYKDGGEVPGQHAVSINLEARTPLFRPDGQPVTAWQKDENSERVGDAPLPIKADYCLRVVGDAIQLVTA